MAGIFDYQAGELNQVKKMTETILESSKGWTPKMVEWVCIEAIRCTPEYERGWEFGLALGDDVNEAIRIGPCWAEDYEWGDPATNYQTMAMLIKDTIEYNRESKGMGEYTLAADLGRWEGYNYILQIKGMDDEIRPVPKMLVEELVDILKEKAMKEDWREE